MIYLLALRILISWNHAPDYNDLGERTPQDQINYVLCVWRDTVDSYIELDVGNATSRTFGVDAFRGQNLYFAVYAVDPYGNESIKSDTVKYFVPPSDTSLQTQTDPIELGVYPNPFNGSTTVEFWLASQGHTEVEIYNIRGRLIKTLLSSIASEGSHTLTWDATGISDGVYICTVKSSYYIKSKKVTLLK